MVETKKVIKILYEILKKKENFKFETDLIISSVTKLSKAKWFIKKELPKKTLKKCTKIAKKRAKNFPLQYLISDWEFYGIPIKVKKKVLIPRQETETLIDVILKFIEKDSKILELCTGSGCISAAIAKNKPNSKIIAIDISRKAIKCSKKNLYDFKNVVKLIRGNVLNKNFAKKFKNFNLIVCNPPYLSDVDFKNLQPELKFEPKLALYGGKDGLKFYELICSYWRSALKKGGYIAFEIGSTQKKSVEKILEKNNFKNIKTFKDLALNDRVIIAEI